MGQPILVLIIYLRYLIAFETYAISSSLYQYSYQCLVALFSFSSGEKKFVNTKNNWLFLRRSNEKLNMQHQLVSVS